MDFSTFFARSAVGSHSFRGKAANQEAMVANSSNRAEVEGHTGGKSLFDVVVRAGSRSSVVNPPIQAEHPKGGDSPLNVIIGEGLRGLYEGQTPQTLEVVS